MQSKVRQALVDEFLSALDEGTISWHRYWKASPLVGSKTGKLTGYQQFFSLWAGRSVVALVQIMPDTGGYRFEFYIIHQGEF